MAIWYTLSLPYLLYACVLLSLFSLRTLYKFCSTFSSFILCGVLMKELLHMCSVPNPLTNTLYLTIFPVWLSMEWNEPSTEPKRSSSQSGVIAREEKTGLEREMDHRVAPVSCNPSIQYSIMTGILLPQMNYSSKICICKFFHQQNVFKN